MHGRRDGGGMKRDGWMHGCMDAWMDGRLDGWRDEEGMEGWMDARMQGWMDGWMGECMAECAQPISAAILAQTTFATSPLFLLLLR